MTASKIGRQPAWRARRNLRLAVNRAEREVPDLGNIAISLDNARTIIREDARLAVIQGLSESAERAYAAMRDAALDQGQSLPAMRESAAAALALLDKEIQRQRPAAFVQFEGQEYQLVVEPSNHETLRHWHDEPHADGTPGQPAHHHCYERCTSLPLQATLYPTNRAGVEQT
jgi:hypothetical protein